MQSHASAEAPAADLLAWVRGSCPVCNLQPAASGVQTCAPAALDEALIAVPMDLLLTARAAQGHAEYGGVAAKLSEWQALVMALLCERAAGPASCWHPYMAALGSQAAHPLLWTAEQRQLLAGSPMVGRLESRLQQVAEDAEALLAAGANELPLAARWAESGQGPLVSGQSVAWAAACLLSRAFSLDLSDMEEPGGEGGAGEGASDGAWEAAQQQADVLALVPLVDLAALTSGDGPALAWDADARAAVLAAERPYAAGEAVAIAAGAGMSASDQLLDWGHVLPGAGGRYDTAPDQVAPPRGSRNRQLLAALGQIQGPGAQLALGQGGPDVTALTWVRAALCSDADLVRAGWRAAGPAAAAGPGAVDAACRAMGRLSMPSSRALEAAVLQAFAEFIELKLRQYPQPPSGGSGGDGGGGGGGGGGSVETQIQAALASEREALASAQAAVAAWQQALGAGCSLEELSEMYMGEDGEEGEDED